MGGLVPCCASLHPLVVPLEPWSAGTAVCCGAPAAPVPSIAARSPARWLWLIHSIVCRERMESPAALNRAAPALGRADLLGALAGLSARSNSSDPAHSDAGLGAGAARAVQQAAGRTARAGSAAASVWARVQMASPRCSCGAAVPACAARGTFASPPR